MLKFEFPFHKKARVLSECVGCLWCSLSRVAPRPLLSISFIRWHSSTRITRTTTDRSAVLVSGMDSQNPSAHLGELCFNGKLIRLTKPLAMTLNIEWRVRLIPRPRKWLGWAAVKPGHPLISLSSSSFEFSFCCQGPRTTAERMMERQRVVWPVTPKSRNGKMAPSGGSIRWSHQEPGTQGSWHQP